MTNRHWALQDAKVKVPDSAKNEDKLTLYGLFKQATVGDIDTKKPGIFDQKGASLPWLRRLHTLHMCTVHVTALKYS